MILPIGTRVRVATRRHGDCQYGNKGVIASEASPGGWYQVRFDPGSYQRGNSYEPKDLEIIDPPKPGTVEEYIMRELCL